MTQLIHTLRHTIDFLLFIVLILDRGDVHIRLVREYQSTRFKVLVAREEHSVEHGLVQQEVAHPLADNDIELGNRQLGILELALDERDRVLEPVRLDDLLRLVDDVRHVDLFCAQARPSF